MILETKIRVRYKETDCMGICYYGNYLTYFEVGRVEYLRECGQAMSDVDQKIHMPVVEAYVKYHKPARLDDLLLVRSWVGQKKRASFRFDYEIRHAETDELIVTGHTLHACRDPQTQKMIGIPPWLGELLRVESYPPGRTKES
jgi:acyl-CoA thioester hydrolase